MDNTNENMTEDKDINKNNNGNSATVNGIECSLHTILTDVYIVRHNNHLTSS